MTSGIVTATNVSQKNGRTSCALRRRAATGPVLSIITTGPTTQSRVMAMKPGMIRRMNPKILRSSARMSAMIRAA